MGPQGGHLELTRCGLASVAETVELSCHYLAQTRRRVLIEEDC